MSVDSRAAATPSGTPLDPVGTRRTLLTETTRSEMRQIIARYPQPRSALLPMLHLVQSVEGYVTQAGIELCAEELDLTTAEVSAVATFYTMYKRRPVGEYHVGVCTNTLCAVLGGDAILHELEHHLGITHDETTEDGRVSLEHIECNAACDYAPVVTVNWEFLDDQSPQSAREAVDTLRGGGTVRSTRGPAICTWRQASRVLAGFNDGLTDEGPAAGPATLAGLRIAREHDWRAPGDARHDHADDPAPTTRHPVAPVPAAGGPGAAQPDAGQPDAEQPGTAQPAAGRPVAQPVAEPATPSLGTAVAEGATGTEPPPEQRPGGLAGAVEAVGTWIGEHLPGHSTGEHETSHTEQGPQSTRNDGGEATR